MKRNKPDPTPDRMIRSLSDLCDYFSADEPRSINRRAYKDTACGASVSVLLSRRRAIAFGVDVDTFGPWVHCGSDAWNRMTRATPIVGFTIQTIIEGSDATVDSDTFTLPVRESIVDAWIDEMESAAAALWRDANDPDPDPDINPVDAIDPFVDECDGVDGLTDDRPCPVCHGPGAYLGTLGTLRHFRCVDCGLDFSITE